MIIYKITNKINGKSYVGQTIYTFEKRYNHNGKWWIGHNGVNIYMKQSALKNGVDNFEISILRKNISSLKELNRLEIYYIKKYNTLYPNGYNFCIGGKNRIYINEIKDKIAQTKRNHQPYFIKNPEGKIFKFYNCKRFCKENKLDEKNLQAVLHRKSRQHWGWTLPETKLPFREFLSPQGERIKVLEGQLQPFCKRNNLIRFCMQQLHDKKQHQHRGWKRYE